MVDTPLPAPTVSPTASISPDHVYLQVWAKSLANVLGQIAGTPFGIECQDTAPPDASPPQESDLQIIVVSSGALRGEMSFALPQSAAQGLAQFFLGETQDAATEFKPDYREAIEELVRQVAGHTRYSTETPLGRGAIARGIWPATHLVPRLQWLVELDAGCTQPFVHAVAAQRGFARGAGGGATSQWTFFGVRNVGIRLDRNWH